MKRLLALLFAITIMICSGFVNARAEQLSGSCGEDVEYSFDTETGTLTISGSGAIADYTQGQAPWFEYREDITAVVFDGEITAIGSYVFAACTNLTDITVPNSVKSVGEGAFNLVPAVKVFCDHPAINRTNKFGALQITTLHYEEPVYTWKEDLSWIHGKVCSYEEHDSNELPSLSLRGEVVDGHELIEEDVFTLYTYTDGPFCTATGTAAYTGYFAHELFSPQSKFVSVDPIGHNWGETPEWSWNSDLTEASAIFTCLNDSSHKQTVTATVERTEGEEEISATATATFNGKDYTNTATKSLKPVFTAVTMSTKGITLYMEEVEGADRYELVLDSGETVQITQPSYTDASVDRQAGESFTYTFRAYDADTDTYSPYSEPMTVIYNPFEGDVDADAAYFPAVAWAYNNKIVNGLSGYDDRFGPVESVQRQHFAIMLWRFAGEPKGSTTNPFADIGSCNATAKKAILWASGKKIIMGTKSGGKTYFKPFDSITREQAMIMLHRFAGSPKVSQAAKDALFATCSDDFSSCKDASIEAMAWALDKGVFIGEPGEDGNIYICPKDDCIRADLCEFLQNYNTNVKKYK